MTKPEPLKGKIYDLSEGLAIHPDDVKSAVEWYKKYRYDIVEFRKDYPEYNKEIILLSLPSYTPEQSDVLFNMWLLDKAFEDVVNKMSRRGN